LRQVKIRADDHFVAITIQRDAKYFVTLFRLIENDVEHHQSRTRLKQSVEQKTPKLARPWIGMFGH